MNTPPGGWPLVIQVAVAILVTIGLSIWQVGRGIDKLNQKNAYETKLSQPPLEEADWAETNFDFRKAQLFGRFDPQRYFIVENRRHQGRPGYWIISIFNTSRDRYLVNRGWTPMAASTRLNPTVHVPAESLSITGIAWPNPALRSPTALTQPDWPIRLREVDIGQMARWTGARALEFRLLESSPGVLQAAPLQMEYATAMHWGYAAQWLLIGALVLFGYWFFTIRKDRDTHKS